MSTKKKAVWSTIQQLLDQALQSVMTPPILFARLLEMKLARQCIRLTKEERHLLQLACDKYLKTKDSSLLSEAIKRKREIEIAVTPNDVRKFERIVQKAVEKTIMHAIPRIAKSTEPIAREWANQHSEHFQITHRNLQEGIARQWKDPLRRFSQFRQLAIHVGELICEEIQARDGFKERRLANALTLLHARACLVTAEIDTLMRSGFADGAMARWRTLHEISVMMAFISERGEETAARYLDHFVPSNLKAANQYEKYKRKLGERSLGKRYLSSLGAHASSLDEKHGRNFSDDYGWASLDFGGKRVTFAMIEENVTLSFMLPFYKMASEQVHASARGAVLRTGLVEQEFSRAEMLAGPTDYGFADAGKNAAKSLLLATASLLQVEPTADANVALLILINWNAPLQQSFLRAQWKIENRLSKKNQPS